jgi:hypothetical protein
MKKIISTFTIILTVILSAIAQDMITKLDGTDIKAKILEVLKTEIKFKKFDNLEGPTFTEEISDLLMIRYQNGTKEIFSKTPSKPKETPEKVVNPTVVTPSVQNNTNGMCEQGKQDSRRFYTGKNSGAGGTIAATLLLSPLAGLLTAASCAEVPPKDINLLYPNAELMRNVEYAGCYKEQAAQTKKKKIWTNVGIGSGIWLLIVLLGSQSGG